MYVTRIAVLMTCHNRRETTLECLESLFIAQVPKETTLSIYLVDDGSTDGTGDSVRERYPDVKVLNGDGSLYWCGGMRLAWNEALKSGYDYYLWLNDDTLLFEDALLKMVSTERTVAAMERNPVILAGATRAKDSEKCTYGGKRFNGFFGMPAFKTIEPTSQPERCDAVNGNCVLVSERVVKRVGILSDDFVHGLADLDYGLRAKKQNVNCWIAPGYIGICQENPVKKALKVKSLSTQEGVRILGESVTSPPTREWLVFTRRHGGPLWPLLWFRTWLRVMFPHLWFVYRKRL